VDVEGPKSHDAVPAPQVDIDDIDIHHDNPAPIEVAPALEEQAPETPAPVSLPTQVHGLPISTRVRCKRTQGYTPNMSGSKYSYAVTQLESQGALNSDAHMFVQDDFYEADPDVVEAIMTKLSL
jgi:hypothetical protein